MAWAPTDKDTRFAMGLPTLGESESASQRQAEAAEGGARRQSAEAIAAKDAAARRDIAQTAANAQIEAARLNANARLQQQQQQSGGGGGGMLFNSRTQQYYAKGGPVITADYKHTHPTYVAYNNSGDSSLLAKKPNR